MLREFGRYWDGNKVEEIEIDFCEEHKELSYLKWDTMRLRDRTGKAVLHRQGCNSHHAGPLF